jgi:hypothetical protein
MIKRGNTVSGTLSVEGNAMIELAIRIQKSLVTAMGEIKRNDETGWSWKNKNADIEYLRLFSGVRSSVHGLPTPFSRFSTSLVLPSAWLFSCRFRWQIAAPWRVSKMLSVSSPAGPIWKSGAICPMTFFRWLPRRLASARPRRLSKA